jgi:hypothetical protein
MVVRLDGKPLDGRAREPCGMGGILAAGVARQNENRLKKPHAPMAGNLLFRLGSTCLS